MTLVSFETSIHKSSEWSGEAVLIFNSKVAVCALARISCHENMTNAKETKWYYKSWGKKLSIILREINFTSIFQKWFHVIFSILQLFPRNVQSSHWTFCITTFWKISVKTISLKKGLLYNWFHEIIFKWYVQNLVNSTMWSLWSTVWKNEISLSLKKNSVKSTI